MTKRSMWTAVGFLVGMALGCTTAAVVAQDPAPRTSPGGQEGAPRAQVVGPEAAERRWAPSGKAMAALYVKGQNAYVGRLEMAADAAVPEHRDPTEEYIYVIEGSGVITIDDVATPVGPGAVIYMPAGAKVSYANGPAPMVAVQVFAGPGPEEKFRQWGEAPPGEAPRGEAPQDPTAP